MEAAVQRGDRIGGRFEIVGEAARGGMGTVFRARDIRSRRDVAIKLVPDADARFVREATILAALDHRAIVRYVSHGIVPDGPSFLVMEWVDGETLASRLARTRLSARDAVAITVQIARALAVLHGAGIVHRDVKPSNIMLVGGDAKLVDFGIARHRSDRLTITGGVVGTVGYMSPEQARGDGDLDDRADVFSLGCVAYECLAGVPAFRGDCALALQIKAMIHDPPRLTTFGVIPELDAIITRMLSRQPAQRPIAAEVADALAAIEVDDDVVMGPRMTGGMTTATTAAPACAVVVASDDDDELERVARLDATCIFSGGAVAIVRAADEAASMALELARKLPTAAVAVAAGSSPGEAIDRGARLIERLDIAAASGAPTAGAWLDTESLGAVSNGFVVERVHDRCRLRRGQP